MKRTNKYLLIILLSFGGFEAFAETSMKPLSKVLNESEAETSTYIYISDRCAGLYLASSELLQGEIREQYLLSAINLLTVSRTLLNKTTDWDLMESLLTAQKNSDKFKNEYSNISDKEYIESGKRVSHMMEDDLLTCRPIASFLIDELPDALRIKEIPEEYK